MAASPVQLLPSSPACPPARALHALGAGWLADAERVLTGIAAASGLARFLRPG